VGTSTRRGCRLEVQCHSQFSIPSRLRVNFQVDVQVNWQYPSRLPSQFLRWPPSESLSPCPFQLLGPECSPCPVKRVGCWALASHTAARHSTPTSPPRPSCSTRVPQARCPGSGSSSPQPQHFRPGTASCRGCVCKNKSS
jgi:hypothetical protein